MVAFFLRPCTGLFARETYGGMSRGQVRIETSWPVSKSLSRFWTCVPRPKVNVSALFDDHPSANLWGMKKTANFISQNIIIYHVESTNIDEWIEHSRSNTNEK